MLGRCLCAGHSYPVSADVHIGNTGESGQLTSFTAEEPVIGGTRVCAMLAMTVVHSIGQCANGPAGPCCRPSAAGAHHLSVYSCTRSVRMASL